MRTHRPQQWYDNAWSALAGLVSGVGLLAGSMTLGPLAMVAILVVMALAIGATLWSVLEQLGRPSILPAVRIAAASGLGCTVAVGLVAGLAFWGLVAFALVALVAPPVLRFVVTRVTRVAREERRASDAVGLRRSFDEIIAYGYSTAGGDDERRS